MCSTVAPDDLCASACHRTSPAWRVSETVTNDHRDENTAHPTAHPTAHAPDVSPAAGSAAPALARPLRRYYRPNTEPRPVRFAPVRSQDGQGWHLTTPDGAASTVTAWTSPAAWLESLAATLATAEGEALRAQFRIRAATVLDVARVETRAADARTGRNVCTAHETVAAEVGCSVSTVRRARDLITALGHAVTLAGGRYLTAAEREEARAAHGCRQVRAASTRALTMPRPRPNEHLPRRGEFFSSLPSRSGLPSRAHALDRAATRPQDQPSKTTTRPEGQPRRRRPCSGSVPKPPRPLWVQYLAAGLAERLPWLTQGRHIGALCDVLTAANVPAGWTAATLLATIDQGNTERGLYALRAHQQRNPLALFAHQLRRALAEHPTPPATAPAAVTRSMRTEHAARIAEDAAARAAAVPPTSGYLAARAALRASRATTTSETTTSAR